MQGAAAGKSSRQALATDKLPSRATYYSGPLATAGYNFSLVQRDGKWVVRDEKMCWISG
jgi:hypothetical protein